MAIGTAGSSSTGTHPNQFLPPIFLLTTVLSPFPFSQALIHAKRPRNDETTLSVLRRAKLAGFTLFVTLDTFLLCPCPHDLDMAYFPFATGVGVQVDTDPVFVERQQLPPRPDEHPAFRLNLDAFRARASRQAMSRRGRRTRLGQGGCKRPTRASSACGRTSSSYMRTGMGLSCSRAFRPSRMHTLRWMLTWTALLCRTMVRPPDV
jgi:hypothetical protein